MDTTVRYTGFGTDDDAWCRAPRLWRGSNTTLCLNATRFDALHDFATSSGLGLLFGLSYPGVDGGVGNDAFVIPPYNGSQNLALLRYAKRTGRPLVGVELGEEMTPEPNTTDFQHLVDAYRRLRRDLDDVYGAGADRPRVLGPCVGMDAETNGNSECLPNCSVSPFFSAFVAEGLVDAVCAHSYVRRADVPKASRGDAAAATWLCRGDESRRRRGCDVDHPCITATTPRPRRGSFVETRRAPHRYNNDGPWERPNFENQTLRQLDAIRAAAGRDAELWCGECGPHNGGGLANVTDTALSTFWYLDALGSVALKAVQFGRQALAGSHYGLLNPAADFEPNPDFYVAALWTRLVGATVLQTTLSTRPPGTPRADFYPAHGRNFYAAASGRGQDDDQVHVYAHCGVDGGVALAFINLGEDVAYNVTVNGVQSGPRLEWRLSAADLASRTLLLNDAPLETAGSALPAMDPVPGEGPLVLASQTLGFATLSGEYGVCGGGRRSSATVEERKLRRAARGRRRSST